MPLWGSRQTATTANSKPIHGFPAYFVSANVDPVTGVVVAVPPGLTGANGANSLFGVTANGMTDASGVFSGKGGPGHAGWVTVQVGRGWIRDVNQIIVAGNNINVYSYAVIRGGNGTSAANIQVGSVSGNGFVGNVTSLVIRNIGAGYNGSASSINVSIMPSPASSAQNAYATVLMGGRAGRIMSETIVAMGSLVGSDPQANNYFVNNA